MALKFNCYNRNLNHFPYKYPTIANSVRQLVELALLETECGSDRVKRLRDEQRIEIWSYPPLSVNGVVDELSLYLTLKDDEDPRVEKELENMMNKIWNPN